MELRPEFVLPTIAKTLRDTVMPAIDETHEVAQEQLGLAIAFLDILTGQLAVLPAYDQDEYARQLAFAQRLRNLESDNIPAQAAEILNEAIEKSPALDCSDLALQLPAATRTLRSATCVFIDAAHRSGDPSLSGAVREIVLSHAETQLKRERAIASAMGFEAGSQDTIPIEEQLRTA